MQTPPRTRLVLALLGGLLVSHAAGATTAQAQADEPSLLSYGAEGLLGGSLIGLSIGYLSTGSHFASEEWTHLAYGAVIGGITGIGAGAFLALMDATNETRRGSVILRDTRYGTLLGTVAGSLVGVLVLIDSGDGQDVLHGAAIGALAGAAVGLVYGLLDPIPDRRRRPARRRDLHITFGAAPTPNGGFLLSGGAQGRF